MAQSIKREFRKISSAACYFPATLIPDSVCKEIRHGKKHFYFSETVRGHYPALFESKGHENVAAMFLKPWLLEI